jgi:V8-like Glu-specific endopeptidase
MNLKTASFTFLLVLLCAGTVAADGNGTTSTPVLTRGQAQAVLEYWTPERLQEATPMPWYDELADIGPRAPVTGVELGPAGFSHGGFGLSGNGTGGGEIDLPPDVSMDGPLGTPDVYDDTFINKQPKLNKSYPWRTIGKLFFTTPSGGGAYCTASVVSPNNIIVTAGHCVWDRGAGAFMSNWVFIPAARQGAPLAPYGTYPWSSAVVLTDWQNIGGREHDVALVMLGPNASGQNVSNQVGWLGRSWNFPIVRHHHSFGYPGNYADGKYIVQCTSESYPNCGSDLAYATGCGMTYGSSGGPWIMGIEFFTVGAHNYVNAVVSGWDACTGTFGQSYNGPRFTDNNIVVLCNFLGC